MAVHLHGVQEALHEVAHIHAVMGDIGIQVFNHAVVGIGLQTGHVDEGAARHVHIGHVGGGQGFVYLVVAGIVYRLDGDEGMLGFKFLDDALKQIGVVVIVERVPEDHLGGLGHVVIDFIGGGDTGHAQQHDRGEQEGQQFFHFEKLLYIVMIGACRAFYWLYYTGFIYICQSFYSTLHNFNFCFADRYLLFCTVW